MTGEASKHRAEAARAQRVTEGLLAQVPALVRTCGATAIFAYVDALEGGALELPADVEARVYYVTKTPVEEEVQEERGATTLRVPNVALTRMSQVKIALFLAMARGLVRRGDTVVCLSGLTGSGTLDTVFVLEVGAEVELVQTGAGAGADSARIPKHIQPEVMERLIDVASELGSEGREGKAVGGLFVVGDGERVLSLCRQLIINPFRGYPPAERNVLDPALEETLKEFSTLDGAFVVGGDGTIETCGAYIKTASQEEHHLPRGLGARHHAAAAITAVTDSIAITISESTGTVTVFRNGQIVTELEKLRTQRVGGLLRPSGPFPRPSAG